MQSLTIANYLSLNLSGKLCSGRAAKQPTVKYYYFCYAIREHYSSPNK